MADYITGVQYRDLYNMAAVTTGAAINHTEEGFGQVAIAGGALLGLPFALKGGKAIIWDVPKFAIQNYGNYGPALKNAWANSFGQTNLYAANRAALKGNFWDTVGKNATAMEANSLGIVNYDLKALEKHAKRLNFRAQVVKPHQTDTTIQSIKRSIERLRNNRAIISNANNQAIAKIYEQVGMPKLMEELKGLKGKARALKLKEIETAKCKANVLINDAKAAGTIQRTTKLGRACSWIKTKSGARAVNNAITKGTTSANAALRTTCKGIKAGGAMAAISMAMEVPTIAEGFKHDKKTGWKQVGYSTATVAAETAGYVAGAKVGGIAGAKIGATIGTCIGGPIGTAIGGAVGAIIGVGVGLFGSWLGGKAVKKVLGKSPVEKAKEKDAKDLANMAKDDKKVQLALAQAATEKIQNGEVNSEQDAIDAAKSIEKVENGYISEIQTTSTRSEDNSSNIASDTTTVKTSTTTNNNKKFAALTALAGGLSKGNSYEYTPFNQFRGFGYNNITAFNPYMMNSLGMGAYSNPFALNSLGFGSYTNPFMFNSYNMGLYNPFSSQSLNPYYMNQDYLEYAA